MPRKELYPIIVAYFKEKKQAFILFCILREDEGQIYAFKIKREIILLQEMQFKRIDKKIGRGKIEEVFSEEVQGYRDLKG